MTEIIKKLGDTTILGLGEIVRYNNRAKIKNENVAEHSYYVAATVLKICQIFNIDDDIKYKALEFSVVHDMGEIFLGDIPYDTKLNNPSLSGVLEKAEILSLEKNMPEYAELFKEFIKEEKEETTAYLVAKLADTVSVLQYSNRERSLGNNTDSMIHINEESKVRIQKLIDKLDHSIDKEIVDGQISLNLSFENEGRDFL